jgi:hypothetical protein
MAHRHWTNDATLTVALWIANNGRDWVAQTLQEIFDAVAMIQYDVQGLDAMQRNTAAKLATEIEEGMQGEVYTASIEDFESALATVDLSSVDYLQIATRVVEDLGCQYHGEQGGFCSVCGFVRPRDMDDEGGI